MVNRYWSLDQLTYIIAGAGNMTCDNLGQAVGKSGEAVYRKLRKIGYRGELSYFRGW